MLKVLGAEYVIDAPYVRLELELELTPGAAPVVAAVPLEQRAELLRLGLIFLGPEFEESVPRLTITELGSGAQIAPLELRGFVRDPVVFATYYSFRRLAEADNPPLRNVALQVPRL